MHKQFTIVSHHKHFKINYADIITGLKIETTAKITAYEIISSKRQSFLAQPSNQVDLKMTIITCTAQRCHY